MAKTSKESGVKLLSGNAFEDLGFADAGERKLKLHLAMEVNRLLAARALKQIDTAKLLGITQPRVSDLACYRLRHFSVEKLMMFLVALDQRVAVSIKPKAVPRARARTFDFAYA